MAFGDSGRYKVTIAGVPFRVDADSPEVAQQMVVDMLQSAPELFNDRAKRLGLDETDVDAMVMASQKGEQVPSVAQSLGRGLGLGSVIPLIIGSRRGFNRLQRGVRQLLAEAYGDEEAVQLIADIDAEEEAIFQKFDERQIGFEDLGELVPAISAFVIPGAQSLTGTALTGAVLGATQVKQEDDITSRSADAGIGAAGSLILPVAGKVGGLAGRLRGLFPDSVSFKGSPLTWFRYNTARSNPGMLEEVSEEALRMTDDLATEGNQIVGRAALDYAGSVVKALPRTQQAGLANEATRGLINRSLSEATDTLSTGVNVFNPAKWEKAMQSMGVRFSEAFRNTRAVESLQSLNTLARTMQTMDDLPPDMARQAANALVTAPRRAESVLNALQVAKSPEVKRSLMQSLADMGVALAARTGRAVPRAIGEQQAEEKVDLVDQAMQPNAN